jgi:lipopolysaccharide biosynthesis protein
LSIHIWLNLGDLTRVLRRVRPGEASRLARPSELGFFAGTMFWARLPAIRDCLDVPTRWFQLESGQIDGTMAHALERLFCVVPELDGRAVFASDADRLVELDYTDYAWPSWALRRTELE